MDEMSADTAKEVITILQNTEILLLLKIPYKLIEFIEKKAEKCDKEIELKANTLLIDQNISDDAKAVLTLIYKDLWCEDNEKIVLDMELQKNDKVVNENKEMSKANEETKTKALIVQKKWHEKLWEEIKKCIKKIKK